METGRFWPICLFGPEMIKFAPNLCYCAVDQKKAVFQWKRAVPGPFAHLGPEMVKFAPNFCYCAVDQKAVVKRKRAVSRFLLLCRRPSKCETPESAQKHSGSWKTLGNGPAKV